MKGHLWTDNISIQLPQHSPLKFYLWFSVGHPNATNLGCNVSHWWFFCRPLARYCICHSNYTVHIIIIYSICVPSLIDFILDIFSFQVCFIYISPLMMTNWFGRSLRSLALFINILSYCVKFLPKNGSLRNFRILEKWNLGLQRSSLRMIMLLSFQVVFRWFLPASYCLWHAIKFGNFCFRCNLFLRCILYVGIVLFFFFFA